jgi:GT2 family glycosyltransferase
MSSDSGIPCASIVVPTRMRADYLKVALASIAPQATDAGAELIVVDDAGPSEPVRELAERFGARYEPHPRPLGLNVARNTGVERSTGDLAVFVDDDVEVRDGWLAALLDAARDHPDVEVFTGPILPRLEGSPPRSCGREGPPITALDLGPEDTPARYAWGANMAIRRHALERVGPFDVSLEYGGDEQEWQERLGSGAMYVAAAALDHRRKPEDTRLRPLCRAAYVRGRGARRFDAWRGRAPSLHRELQTLAGCLGHVLRRRCPAGLTMVAHSAGRVWECIRFGDAMPARAGLVKQLSAVLRTRAHTGHPKTEHTHPPTTPHAAASHAAADGGSADVPNQAHARMPGESAAATDDFLSGVSGTVGGLDGLRRGALDVGTDALELASGRGLRLRLAARRSPPTRRVLVLVIERPEHRRLVERLGAELARSRHEVELCLASPEDRGKFENLNLLLDSHPPGDRDWLLVLDDDIVLPHGFLDRFLFLAERFELDLAQPAHRRASHAAWQVTRRQPGSLVRQTSFVEIGPVTAFARSTFATLLPFPDLRMGWGLDLHWAALARERDWRCGVIDAVAIRHRAAPTAGAYSREQALSEARAFLESRPYLNASEAQQTLVTHRRW